MGTYDPHADSPNQIKIEGQEITLTFTRTSSTQGIITWNVPTPAYGCTATTQAYNGIIITLDTVPATLSTTPTDGETYTGDPTADTALFAGDKIGTALVIGAYYNDKTTVSFDVTGLTAGVAYYISGYAVDNVNRYHTAGVHSYSLDDQTVFQQATSGFQRITLQSGTDLTTTTGLVSGQNYTFSIIVNGTDFQYIDLNGLEYYVTQDGTKYNLTINGTNAQTYGDLINAINVQMASLPNVFQGTVPPNTGAYYWNNTSSTLYLWNGTQQTAQSGVILDTTDPVSISVNDYWYNGTTLYQAASTGPVTWNTISFVDYLKDPRTVGCGDYWLNKTGGKVYERDTIWIEKTLHDQTTDPSAAPTLTCEDYWYNTTTLVLSNFNETTCVWDAISAIYWSEDPNLLSAGTYWFDETNQVLNVYSGVWTDVSLTSLVYITSTEPTSPAASSFWYDPSTDVLQQRNGANTAWTILTVLSWPTDPTVRTTGDLWWDSLTDVLYIWDVVTTAWVAISGSHFYQQATDPSLAPTLVKDQDIWYDGTSLYNWDGTQWVSVNFILYASDPTAATIWHDNVNDIWYSWSGTAWVVFTPTVSANDPSALPAGTFWYNGTTLYQWNGASWVSIIYSTTSLIPAKGTQWFDTSTDTLYQWNGSSWTASTPLASVEYKVITTDNQNNVVDQPYSIIGSVIQTPALVFTQTSGSGGTSTICIIDGTLFSSLGLVPNANWDIPYAGHDQIGPDASYDQLGVGTDGSSDERRALVDRLHRLLGYPSVEVELSKEQFDIAIDRALSVLRERSGAAYKRGFFFMIAEPQTQSYTLADKIVGFNKIVHVTAIYRITSAFLTNAYGSGVYGQVILQHMYNMGTFDLLSYALVNEYIHQLEHLFATRITFQWTENKRRLDIFQTFPARERLLVDATIERTEQDLIKNRMTKAWIERYALAMCKRMLADVRGKFNTLPGAGGGISLNAAELASFADQEIILLEQQIDDFIVEQPEEFGMGSTFTFG